MRDKNLDVVFTMILGGVAVILALWLTGVFDRDTLVLQAILQCEAELPRHQHCEPVYGARIVEGER